MKHRNCLPEMRRELFQKLRRQRYLRHEQNRTLSCFQRLINQADIDGGFSASGHAVQQRRARLLALHLQTKPVKCRLLFVV